MPRRELSSSPRKMRKSSLNLFFKMIMLILMVILMMRQKLTKQKRTNIAT